uniref:aspartate--tRNA ligase n=1 Tax=Albugo laibachii Nc14 TaxID=890382 RepID=F0X0M0_9STRA|nr:aspartyltRNA synthetase putative [Albugo laibachii Nc14]|eukprot:CCA27311.1 aspartyltRNA synthetase putative [Albugo laibachii Nc14]
MTEAVAAKNADETAQPSDAPPKKLTKKELRILERQKAVAAAAASCKLNDVFGEKPLLQSQHENQDSTKKYHNIGQLHLAEKGSQVWVRGYLQNVRSKSKIAFLLLRQSMASIQAILTESDQVPRTMIKFASGIPKESVVEMLVTITAAKQPIVSTSQKDIELQVHQLFLISKAMPELPFQVEDAARPDALVKAEGSTFADVGLDTRLNTRVLDLRTPANQAIMRIQAGVCRLFREFLDDKGFVEIHTPKLIGGASESGASVFKLKYFDQEACLAQSPQTYKQMACACGGLERVYEIGPVFRAENSNTHRHMCEFVGLDLEMVIQEHYHEVVQLFSDLFIYIFDNLTARFADELAAVNKQHPFEPLKYKKPSLILSYEEGVKMLHEAGAEQNSEDDLSTENEKWLGRLVKEKYDTDFYILNKYPLAVRPFYTMPDSEDTRWSNSYDIMIRGEEIVSGAQRVHDAKLLEDRLDALNVPKESLKTYIDAFRLGALPHGGGGIGLERVVMLYLGLGNIRKASMFPRDPKRLFP